MVICAFNTFYVPSKLMPYHIPLIFRGADTSDWLDRIRLHNSIFTGIVILAGCLPSVGITNTGKPCLRTTDPDILTLEDIDHFQYQLDILLWMIMIPGLIMMYSTFMKDAGRIICYPILIANLIFGFMMVITAVMVLFYVVYMTDNSFIRYLHLGNIGAFLLGVILNQLYARCCERRDIVKAPGEDDQKEQE